MQIILNRIQFLCKINDTNVKRLEEALGFANGTIGRWGKSIPSSDSVQKIADYFDVSIDFLMGRTDNMTSHRIDSEMCEQNILRALEDIKAEFNDLLERKLEETKRHIPDTSE